MKDLSYAGLETLLENNSAMGSEALGQSLAGLEAILGDEQQRQEILEKKDDDAQRWLDVLQLLADSPIITSKLRSTIFTLMIRLSKNSGCCPQCLVIQNVEKQGEHPVGGGGFGDVWKGTIRHAGSMQVVCLKVVRLYLTSDMDRPLKEYLREAIVWKQLNHPNVVPFLGIYFLDNTRQRICLVSPWMERGDLVQYLKETPRESVDHIALVFDVASGLSHLHSKKIVHADLKGVNILMTPSERACITDFGLSRISDTNAHKLSSSKSRIGTARWLAPELLGENATPTKESDVYAFACVCYEILTGLLPFHEFKNDAAVALQVISGTRPSRPELLPTSPDALWDMMDTCWQADPSARPSASTIMLDIAAMQPTPIIPAPPWDESTITKVRSNIEHSPTLNEPLDSLKQPSNGYIDHASGKNMPSGSHIRWIRDQSRRQRALSPARSDTDGEEIRAPRPLNLARLLGEHSSGSPRPDSSGSSLSDASDSYASTTSSIFTRYFPKRFFVVKSDLEDVLADSVDSGIWSGGNFDEQLERASRTSLEVFLVFAVHGSKGFWGYAKIIGNAESGKQRLSPSPLMTQDHEIVTNEPLRLAIGDGPPRLAVRSPSGTDLPDPTASTEDEFDLSSVPHSPTSPLPMDDNETPQSPTPRTRDIGERHTAPGELGDVREKMSMPTIPPQFSLDAAMDKLVGSLHAIYIEDSSSNLPEDVADTTPTRDNGSNGEGMITDAFQLEWICTEHLPYRRTRQIRNPWDRSQEVRFSKDGYELEPGCGQQLIDEWQRYVVEQRAGDRGLPRRRQTESSASSG